MLREIISTAEQSITLHLPKDMVGKTIAVIAFEINGSKIEMTKAERRKQIDDLTKNNLMD